jgi:hypothetical protein
VLRNLTTSRQAASSSGWPRSRLHRDCELVGLLDCNGIMLE